MKLVIFGATGKIGRHLTEQALAQNHQVTAYARNPEKVEKPHKNLTILKGDVLDSQSVEQAIKGQDGVLCAIGMPLMNKDKLRSKGTSNIVRAMEKTGVKRLVCLSAFGAGDSKELLPFHYKFLIVPLLMRRLFADHNPQEKLITASSLDWVIARPGNFIKGVLTGAYRHGFKAGDKAPKLKISHEDVADFMLKQLADDTYLHQAPGLSY